MNILMLLLFAAPTFADTVIPVGTAEIAPGTLVTRQMTWFEVKNDRALVVLKATGDAIDDYGDNGHWNEEIWFSVHGLEVDRDRTGRKVIRYG
jgi:hypothetical protein